MTNVEKFTNAELAQLNEHLAQYGVAVDAFVQQAVSQVYLEGPVVATAVLADHLATELDEDQLASVAAIALVRLARSSGTAGT